jgi:hypothetical protein
MNAKQTTTKDIYQRLDNVDRLISETNARLETKDLNYVDRLFLEKNLSAILAMRADTKAELERAREKIKARELKAEKKKDDLFKIIFAITCVVVIVYLLSCI